MKIERKNFPEKSVQLPIISQAWLGGNGEKSGKKCAKHASLGFPLEKFSKRKYPHAFYPSFPMKPFAPQDAPSINFFNHSTKSSLYVLLFIFVSLSFGKNWNIVTGVKSYVTLHRDILSFTRSQPWRCLHHPTCLPVPRQLWKLTIAG